MTQLARQAADVPVVGPVSVSYRLATPVPLLPGRVLFDTGHDVLALLQALARLSQRESRPRTVDWRVTSHSDGQAEFRPIDEPDLAQLAAVSLVKGLETAEKESRLEETWDPSVAAVATRMARRLGETDTTGLAVAVSGEGYEHGVTVTRRAATHLVEASRQRITSYGSVSGVLGGVSAWPRRRAALWNDLDGRRVEVRFTEQHDEDVRAAWAKEHVEVTGVVYENSAGQVLRVDMESLQLPQPGGLRLADLPRGSYPDMTGGLGVLDYLDSLRGAD